MATVVSVVSNHVALLNRMTALSGRIELGGDLPIVVKSIRCAKATRNTGHRFSFVVGQVVHRGDNVTDCLKNVNGEE